MHTQFSNQLIASALLDSYQAEGPAPIIREVVAESVSSRYTPVSTNELVAALESRGFTFRSIKGGYNNKKGHTTKHVVRMTYNRRIQVNNDWMAPEIVISNSFDARSALRVEMGIFRVVCSNGLTIKLEDFGTIYLRHLGDADEMAMEILDTMLANIEKITGLVEEMYQKVLTEEEAIELAMAAAAERWKKAFTRDQAKVLLQVARPEDDGLELFKVMNRIQENALTNSSLRVNNRKVRMINNPTNYERVNSKIFSLAAEMLN